MSKRLYVGNLNFSTTHETLQTVFGEFGTVITCTMPTDRETGLPRGFAFVDYATSKEAEAAICSLDGKIIDGRPLRVIEHQERAGRDHFGPGGGGGGGRGGRDRF
ncbi:hypothetical protein BDN72DRAFT_851643 [Pluteus cervinus]|uniref:Uncharacterized protein n=1 Tax=Pluteus cervinus TaxID=181527 RepID=A0ACD3A1B7_9AGAR|nr:hypothetical protein BDN72DRAFT_851643 [Pluteus cervinus]